MKAAESALQEREHARRRAGQPHQAGARRPRKRPLRPEQGPHRVAHRRHRHAPQHSGRRNGRRRHDEQRRHRAAHAGRHVGHSGRSRSRRDQYPERAVRTRRPRSRSTRFPTGRSRDTSRKSATAPIQATGTRGTTTQATNFKVVVVLDEEVPDVRPGFTCTADITTATRKASSRCRFRPSRSASSSTTPTARSSGAAHRQATRDARSEPTAAAAELKPGQTRKETEGVFVLRSGRAEFVPIKVGIAGDKYFEVLSGLKEGDQVITGPYNSVRGMVDGDQVKVDRRRRSVMNKFLDSATIALEAIWAAKLRSFMTVLGNIVAVTSIIAVVSLIQGTQRVGQARDRQPGGRRLVQHPAVSGHAERRRLREGPLQPADLAAGRARDSPLRQPAHRRGHGRRQRAGPRHLSRPIDRQHQRSGPDGGLRRLLGLRRRTRPPHDADRSRHGTAGHRHRLADRRPAVRPRASIRWTRSSRSKAPTSASSASAQKRVDPRPVAGRVRAHPARPVPDDVRIAPAAQRSP